MTLKTKIEDNVRFNFIVNVIDGGLFGMGLGLASYVTIIPLFIATLTDSTLVIGLIATLHTIGWQAPQLLTSFRVSGLRRYKPMTLWMTLHERWPFFGLGVVALLIPVVSVELALILAFIMVLWQSLGGGFTGTAWQSLISKIMPLNIRGTFYGSQSAAGNLLMSVGGVIAGVLLGALEEPYNFAACFFLAGLAMTLSYGFLATTREPEHEPSPQTQNRDHRAFRADLKRIMKTDSNFRWFLIARTFSQFSSMAISFYTIYAVRQYNMPPEVTGLMLGVLSLSQMATSPIVGWLGDRWGHRWVLALGNMAMVASAGIAIAATDFAAFYLVFALAGLFNSVNWTTALAMVVEFGQLEDRPLYIGLGNTLIAPATLAAPIIGGWLADAASFDVTFMMCVIAGLIAAAATILFMRDPIPRQKAKRLSPQPSGD